MLVANTGRGWFTIPPALVFLAILLAAAAVSHAGRPVASTPSPEYDYRSGKGSPYRPDMRVNAQYDYSNLTSHADCAKWGVVATALHSEGDKDSDNPIVGVYGYGLGLWDEDGGALAIPYSKFCGDLGSLPAGVEIKKVRTPGPQNAEIIAFYRRAGDVARVSKDAARKALVTAADQCAQQPNMDDFALCIADKTTNIDAAVRPLIAFAVAIPPASQGYAILDSGAAIFDVPYEIKVKPGLTVKAALFGLPA